MVKYSFNLFAVCLQRVVNIGGCILWEIVMNRDLLEKFTRHRSDFYNLTPSPRRRQVAVQQPLPAEQEANKPLIKKKEYVDR